jgi:hypothetical protein
MKKQYKYLNARNQDLSLLRENNWTAICCPIEGTPWVDILWEDPETKTVHRTHQALSILMKRENDYDKEFPT